MLLNKVPIILTTYMYDNLKLECPWTMNKNNDIKLLYLVNDVYIWSLQALYKLLNVIVLLFNIYVHNVRAIFLYKFFIKGHVIDRAQ